jgi:integrase
MDVGLGDQHVLMPTNTLITGDQHALMLPHAQAQTALEVIADQHELMLATCKQEIGQVHNVEITETARELISSAWRESSKNTYAIYVRKYKKFAEANKFDYLQPTEIQVANFLSSCFEKGYGYSAIKVARAAVSSIILMDFSQSKILKRLMRGVFQKRPQLQRTMTWDVKIVLDYLRKISPAKKLSIGQLTMKTAMLLLLTMSQRQQALHLLDARNLQIKYDRVGITFGDPLKMTGPNFHQRPITVLSYPVDKRLCPVWYLKKYLKRTNRYRNHNNVFLITMKPFTPATKSTISTWIRKGLTSAGVDLNIFTPHSTRAAAVSKLKKANVSITTIVNTAGWRNTKTFAKFYDKKIVHNEVSVQNLL